MSRDKLLPRAQLDSVIKALYASADNSYWSQLGPQDRSEQYDQWVEDPEIGGVLTRYMTPEAARSWLKDGPMKEYARSLRGEGRYAQFGRQGGTSVEEIVHYALGSHYEVVEGTRRVKPSRCAADDGNGEQLVVWGDAKNFKNLQWSALRDSLELGVPGTVVVLEPPGSPTDPGTALLFERVSSRCGLKVIFMAERVAR